MSAITIRAESSIVVREEHVAARLSRVNQMQGAFAAADRRPLRVPEIHAPVVVIESRLSRNGSMFGRANVLQNAVPQINPRFERADNRVFSFPPFLRVIAAKLFGHRKGELRMLVTVNFDVTIQIVF